MRRTILVTLLSLLILGNITAVSAQDYIPIFSRNYGSRLSVEIDPLSFIFRGYSLHLKYQPMFSERVLMGIGAYGLDVPDWVVNSDKDNRDKGWDVRVRRSFFVSGEYFPKKANYGWFIGEQIGLQSFRVSNQSEVRGSTDFNTLLLMTYVGYSWHPYKGSFYIKPWIGLGYLEKIDGINKIGTTRYDVGPLYPFLTFHAGYTF